METRAAPSHKPTAEMSGHNTPDKALTQMTKLQNATARRTPAKPAWGVVAWATARVAAGPVEYQNSAETVVSAVLMAMPLSRPAGSRGDCAGFGAGNSFFAQQHDLLPAQHWHDLAAGAVGGGMTPPGNT